MNNPHAINIGEQIDDARRMLGAARDEHYAGHDDDTLEFLRAARRHIDEAIHVLEPPADVVELRGVPDRRTPGR